MDAFKDWFLQSTPREQIMLGVCGVIVLVTLLYMITLYPLGKDLKAQERINRVATEQLMEVRRLAGLVLAERKSGPSGKESLTTLLNKTMRKHGLAFEDFKPGNKGDVRIRLAKAELNKIMAWINEIENGKGVQVKDITITKGEEAGTALVNLKLYRGG